MVAAAAHVLLILAWITGFDFPRRPRDVADVGLLLVLFTVVPPLAAFGVYFGGRRALRHTARLVAADRAVAQ